MNDSEQRNELPLERRGGRDALQHKRKPGRHRVCGTLGAARRGRGRFDGLKDELGRSVGLRDE